MPLDYGHDVGCRCPVLPRAVQDVLHQPNRNLGYAVVFPECLDHDAVRNGPGTIIERRSKYTSAPTSGPGLHGAGCKDSAICQTDLVEQPLDKLFVAYNIISVLAFHFL